MQKREEGFYLYRFLDKCENVIYVGKTNNMKNRMSGHKSKSTYIGEHDSQREMYESIYKVEFCILENEYQMDIYEIHFISLLQPKFNDTFKHRANDYMDIDVKWNTYIFDIMIRLGGEFIHQDTGLPYTIVDKYKKINTDDQYLRYIEALQECGGFVPLYFEGFLSGVKDPSWVLFEENLIASNFDEFIEEELSEI